MQISLAMAAVGVFSAFGFWRHSAVAFFTAAGCSAMVYTQFFDLYDNDFALGVSLMFLLWTIYCLFEGIRCLLPRSERD